MAMQILLGQLLHRCNGLLHERGIGVEYCAQRIAHRVRLAVDSYALAQRLILSLRGRSERRRKLRAARQQLAGQSW